MPYIKQRIVDILSALFEENQRLHRVNGKICKENSILRELLLSEKYENILAFPKIEDKDYAILICNKVDKVSSFSVDFYICDMSRNISNPATIAHIIVHKSTIEVVSISALKSYRRLGLASLCLRHIETFAHKYDIKEIYGIIDDFTDIGKDNLVLFYQKNGYVICPIRKNVDGFKKEICYDIS